MLIGYYEASINRMWICKNCENINDDELIKCNVCNKVYQNKLSCSVTAPIDKPSHSLKTPYKSDINNTLKFREITPLVLSILAILTIYLITKVTHTDVEKSLPLDTEIKSSVSSECVGEWFIVLYENIRAYSTIEMNMISNSISLKSGSKVCVIDSLQILQHSENTRRQSKIIYEGQYYWLPSSHLRKLVHSNCREFNSNRILTVATNINLNVRQGINDLPNSRIIGALAAGSNVCPIDNHTVNFTGWANEWVKVRLESNQIGWVARKYLRKN